MRRFLFSSLAILLTLQVILLWVLAPAPLKETFWRFLLKRPEARRVTFYHFSFNHKEDLEEWDDKAIQGKAHYWIDFQGNEGYVHSEAKESASAKYRLIRYNPRKNPYLSWRWRAGRFPEKANASDPKLSDDYPARIFVIFASRFFKNFRCVEYVWDDLLPEGTIRTSPFSDQIRQIVLRSGLGNETWHSEERNVLEDYRKAFRESAKQEVRAIAMMTDADSTQSVAEGFFDEIWIGSLKGRGALS